MSDEPTLENVIAEQPTLVVDKFDYAYAWELGSRIRKEAEGRQLPVAIEVTHGLDRVFFSLLPGATPDNFDWTHRKAAVAHRFHCSSLQMRLAAQQAGYDFNTRFRLPISDFAASGGAVPLIVKNAGLVGVAAVSGLRDFLDHALIVDAIRSLKS